MHRGFGSLHPGGVARHFTRLVEKERMRDARRRARHIVSREVPDRYADAKIFPQAVAGAGVEDEAPLNAVVDVCRSGLEVALNSNRSEKSLVVDWKAPLTLMCTRSDQVAARSRSAATESASAKEERRMSPQLTPTAVQAWVTARSAALLAPKRSRAAWIVAARATANVAFAGSIWVKAR